MSGKKNPRTRSRTASDLIGKALASQPLRTLHTEISGNDDGKTLFFLAGYPDKHDCWDAVIGMFRKDFRCVVACMPCMDVDTPPKKTWGYSNDEIVALVAATVQEVSPDEPVTMVMVTHDWGAHYGFQFQSKFRDQFTSNVLLPCILARRQHLSRK